MSRITWQTEQRTSFDPWTDGDLTVTLRTGWTCGECGKTSPKKLRRHFTLEDYAAWHLAEHVAPRLNHDGPCVCEWAETMPIASMTSATITRRHEIHHHAWLLEVWDS